LRRADDELMVKRIHRANVAGAKSSNYPQAAGDYHLADIEAGQADQLLAVHRATIS
jgi:hypothetical protein